ncbi:MAG: peptide-methionine (R)-S-oxide reductase MsrB [Chthoniobacterales bacterium]
MRQEIQTLALVLACALMNTDSTHAQSMTRNLPKEVSVRFADEKGFPEKPKKVPTIIKSDAEWQKILSPDAYRILRSHATERPHCGLLLDNKKPGIYFCAGCDLPLFSSVSKFQSGTGWPSFFAPFAAENIGEEFDESYGMRRTEIYCIRCGGHLGHVFTDGPKPTGLRYCLNSEAMTFKEYPDLAKKD